MPGCPVPWPGSARPCAPRCTCSARATAPGTNRGCAPAPEQHAALLAVPWGPRPGLGAGERVSLAEVVRQRAVALFALAGTGPKDVAEAIAGLVAADAAALYGSLYRGGIAPDGLCWFTECDGVDPVALAGLVAAGSPAGLAPVLATTVPRAAGGLAGRVNAVVVHRLTDRGLAGELATLTGTTIVPLSRAPASAGAEYGNHTQSRTEASPAVPLGTIPVPLVPAESLCALGSGDFVLVTGLTAVPAGGRQRGGAGVTVRRRAGRSARPSRRGRSRRRCPGTPAFPSSGGWRDARAVPAGDAGLPIVRRLA